jgi:acylglycerol lipase
VNVSFPTIETYQARDGDLLAVRVWRPASVPLARVVFLHGIVSHGGWYASSSSHLAENGYEVHFLERRGSGLNSKDRGDVAGWKTWLEDVEVYLEHLGNDCPRVLCGISWGGKLAAAVALHRPDLIDGLGLLCPGLFARQQPGLLKQIILSVLSRGWVARRRVRIPLNDPALFTNSPRHQIYVRDDPLALRNVTLRFARADLLLTRFVCEATLSLKMPTLLVLAGQDKIVVGDPTRDYLEKTVTHQKTLHEYPTAAHTLEFESQPDQYFTDLHQWMEGIAN